MHLCGVELSRWTDNILNLVKFRIQIIKRCFRRYFHYNILPPFDLQPVRPLVLCSKELVKYHWCLSNYPMFLYLVCIAFNEEAVNNKAGSRIIHILKLNRMNQSFWFLRVMKWNTTVSNNWYNVRKLAPTYKPIVPPKSPEINRSRISFLWSNNCYMLWSVGVLFGVTVLLLQS